MTPRYSHATRGRAQSWWASYIQSQAGRYGLDPRALLAVARQEGLGGGVGDAGTSFGPFQLHVGGALPRGKGRGWAESRSGIDYALSQIAGSGARGLSGRAAIEAIVRNFERPAAQHIGPEIARALAGYGGAGSSPSSPAMPAGGQSGANIGSISGGGGNPRAAFAQALLTPRIANDPMQLLGAIRAVGAPQAPPAPSLAGTSSGAGGSSSRMAPGKAGGFLPQGATYVPGRLDAGHDLRTDPGGPIIAPGSGRVVAVKSDPGGFGPSYPVVYFDSGPYAGQYIYIGHTYATLRSGQRFSRGQVISRTGRTGVGNARTPGWAEIGYAPGGTPGHRGQRPPFR